MGATKGKIMARDKKWGHVTKNGTTRWYKPRWVSQAAAAAAAERARRRQTAALLVSSPVYHLAEQQPLTRIRIKSWALCWPHRCQQFISSRSGHGAHTAQSQSHTSRPPIAYRWPRTRTHTHNTETRTDSHLSPLPISTSGTQEVRKLAMLSNAVNPKNEEKCDENVSVSKRNPNSMCVWIILQ